MKFEILASSKYDFEKLASCRARWMGYGYAWVAEGNSTAMLLHGM